MNMPLHQKLEIYFWDVVIQLLTQSPVARKLVQDASNFFRRRELFSGLVVILTGGMVGLMLGIVLPVVFNTLR